MNVHLLGYTGSVQHEDSGNVSMVVTHDRTAILIDVSGAPVMELNKAGIELRDLTMVLITHAHIDHIYALPSLLHQLWLTGRSESLVVLGNRFTIQKARELCDVFMLEQKKRMFQIVWEVLEEGVYPGTLGSLRLSVFPVPHGVPAIGCAFEADYRKFVYFADCTSNFTYPAIAYDAHLLIHEAGGLTSDEPALAEKGHSSARQAALAARTLHAGSLVLCHLPERFSCYPEMIAEAKAVFEHTQLPELYKPYEV